MIRLLSQPPKHLLGISLFVACLLLPGALFASTELTKSRNAADRQVMDVLDNYMASFNALDIESHRSTYHFPHYRLASGRMRVIESGDKLTFDDFMDVLKEIGWHHSNWDKREISMRSEDKIHVNTRFTRYREDGSSIGSYDSLYVLTKENGKWGVKMRSSFAP